MENKLTKFDYKDFNLTKKQYAFCEEYLTNGFNQKNAAIKAGFKEKNACAMGAHLLADENVKSYLDYRLSIMTNKFNEVIACLTSIALGEDTDQIPLLEQGSQYLADKKIDSRDRVKAGSELIKYYQFKEKIKREDLEREDRKKNNNIILENLFRQLKNEEEATEEDMQLDMEEGDLNEDNTI